MLSAFPATLSADSFLGNPFPPFEPGFPPWEYHEPSFLFPAQEEPVVLSPQFSQEPVRSNSGSDPQNPSPSSGFDEPNRDKTKTSCDGSDGSDGPNRRNFKNKRPRCCETSILDERKRRRMISNRESARRSRVRKQRHMENLRNQANRLKVGNREQMNRLRVVVHQAQLIRSENECLRAEAAMLRQRLWDIRQVLVVRQLQQLYPAAMH